MKKSLIALFTAGAGLIASQSAALAQFNYNPTDVLLAFRSPTVNYDYVVNLGPVSQFYLAAPGSTINITGYDAASLTSIFGSLDGLSYSLFADVRTFGSTNGAYNTLWVSEARTDINVQTSPWNRGSQAQQGTVGGQIDGIANGALAYGGLVGADGVTNSFTAITIYDTYSAVGGTSYTVGVGPAGNFANTFQNDVENVIPTGFAGGDSPLRSDFYQLNPGSGEGTYLGYFELGTDGSLTFTAVPEPSTWALMGLGGFLLLAVNRLRRPAQS